MNKQVPTHFLWLLSLGFLCTVTFAGDTSSYEVVAYSEVQWAKLNPARGEQSPRASTLWGDRKGEVPTGFLAKFVDGFSSPPHIHNATYRAVVIHGLIHNDDPAAAKMWMPPGSFWTQPKGETHITAAKGPLNVALVEIDKGPYLVKPPEQAFDSGERPINMDPSNIVWVDLNGRHGRIPGVKVAYLWGSQEGDQTNGMFLKLPAGFEGTLHSKASFRAVVISGRLQYSDATKKQLDPGSYFGATAERKHPITALAESEVILYTRADGAYQVVDNTK
ncbi:DUF4437 domain-containing protein [Acanthopleuribacter pedis]|uniref:DUF4437 domain-containing protein n=1 Tax=Acanthopleuribacter pedis TaxID=442870 RepID=A0A8J7QCZ1_9BACT|nr:DUF4437 domain-containing protein [Acanthopleuribacter pedis]MBO1323461.1 DUF4437 domain-containing protein [Acanthopleuribacter pedis]